jgi:hypothetical protein
MNAIRALPNAPLGVSLSKASLAAFGSRLVSQATKAATTVANAEPMMKATASSTRLPRSRKFLNPVMGCSCSGRLFDRCGGRPAR